MNIGIICMATGVYERFWADFYESVDRYFCADAPKTFYLFTDSETLLAQTLPNVRAIRMDDRGWSTNILRRSELFLSIEEPAHRYDDLTIVIPVRVDSAERARNLERVLNQLEGYPGLKVVVLEADIVARWSPRDGVRYVYVQDHNPLFHRTKYINMLCGLCDTPYMGVWDTDVIVPRPQFDEALELLRQQRADMVYPYDGRFYNVHGSVLDTYFQKPEESSLFAFFLNSTPTWGHHSCGGAFLVDRKAYIAAGGENEAFRGWGPEDLERYKRWEIKGYRVARVEGPIFHLDHPRGANSRYFDLELMRSTMQTLFQTCRRTK